MAYSLLQGERASRDRVDIAHAVHARMQIWGGGQALQGLKSCPCPGKVCCVCFVVYSHSLALLQGEGR